MTLVTSLDKRLVIVIGQTCSTPNVVEAERVRVSDKRMDEDEVVAELHSGMTIGIGGWGSRRQPMSLVRAILRSELSDLTIVSYGGPDVGLLCAAGKVKRLVYGFVSLDSIALEPHFRTARMSGSIEAVEYDEGMLQWGLYAASLRLPFLPTRAGLGSDVMRVNPGLRTVRSPYGEEEFVAMPALQLDAALVHLNRADRSGNAQCLGPDLYFDDLFCAAATRAYVSCEQIVETAEFADFGPPSTLRISRLVTHGVVQAPNGAHFTSCAPDYGRDEAFQREYATAAADPDQWQAFAHRYLYGDEQDYQEAVRGRTEQAS
jgi:glutaconate CoA-transferase, subunit A